MSSTALFRTEAEIARRFERSGPIRVDTSLGAISLRLTSDLQSLEALWEELQAKAPCGSAQTYDWAKAWVRHMAGPEGHESVIVVGCAADGGALFLWPFEIETALGLRVLTWLSQGHANYAMGLFAPGVAGKFTAGDISRLLRAVAREAGAAAAILKGQPFSWEGVANPFARLPGRQPSPSSGYAVTLGDYAAIYEARFSKRWRKGFERKERKLAEAGIATFSSLAEGELQKYSPGSLLLNRQIEDACRQGLAFYDIGVGAAVYKDQWCDVIQALFDNFIALKPQGLLVTLPLAASSRLKRAIKSNRHLWPLVQRLRARFLGGTARAAAEPSDRGDAGE
jgi:CelD/BcsL family acetyltransferase involved in cellulose biosynthesis